MRGTKAKRMRKLYGESRDVRHYETIPRGYFSVQIIAVGARRAYQNAKKLVR